MTTTTAIYHDREGLTRAVRALLGASVPADAIRVTLRDADGRTLEEVPVRAEPGVLRGLLTGAAVGAGIGALAFLLMVVGVLPPGREILSADGLPWAFRLVLGGAAAAAPLGGLLGMGRWRMRSMLDLEHADSADAFVVAVRSDQRAPTARDVFDRTGAEAVAEDRSDEGPEAEGRPAEAEPLSHR